PFSFRKPVSKPFTKGLQRLAHVGLDRLDRHAECLGDFRVFESLDAAHLEDLAAARRQLFERATISDLELVRLGAMRGRGSSRAIRGGKNGVALLDLRMADVVER